MIDDFTLLVGDSACEMSLMDSDLFDLVVTSPPYDGLRTYGGLVWDFESTAKEMFRIIKPGGVCCWVVSDAVIDGSESLTSFRQAIYFKDVCGFKVSDTLIWKKVHVAAPNSRQYHQMHEYVFVLSKGIPKTFNPIKDRPNKYAGKSPFGHNSKRNPDGEMKVTSERKPIADFGKRSNVWEGNSRAQENPCAKLQHPAMMPKWLARDLILSWSNVGDLILDPFLGSGTVAMEGLKVGRKVVGIERNGDYVPVINSFLSPGKSH